MNLPEKLQWIKYLDKRYLASVAVHYAVTLALLTLGVLPSVRSLATLRSKASEAKKQNEAARTTLAQAKQMESHHASFLELIRRRENQFFTNDELPQLLAIISDLAQQNGLQMTASKPVYKEKPVLAAAPPPPAAVPPKPGMPAQPPPPPKNFYASQEFEVMLSGGYHALGAFLSALKKYPKLMQVSRLSVTAGANPTEHKITLAIAVFTKLPNLP